MVTFEPRRILVPTDYSDSARAALLLAANLAKTYGSKLTVLHSDGLVPPAEALISKSVMAAAFREQAKELEKDLADHVATNAPGIAVQRLVRNDTPSQAILRTAEEIGADLIVMGTHGKSGFKRFVIGSVAQEVLHNAKVPVITVRETTRGLHRILCPVDYSEISRKSLETATQLAQRNSAELVVLHLIELGSVSDLENELDQLDYWAGKDAPASTHKRLLPAHENAAEQIARYAREREVDLIVIGAQHRRFSDRSVLGTTAYDLIRRAGCPVLTISTLCPVPEEPWLTEEDLRECLKIW